MSNPHTPTPSIAQSSSSSIENLTYQQQSTSINEFSNLDPFPSDENKKTCYICHANEDENNEPFVNPCKCAGSLRFTHQTCLQQWVDTISKNQNGNKIRCPQCKTQYIIIFPNSSKFVYCLELIDKLISSLSPYFIGTIFCCSVYWVAFSYGALTILQTIGFEKGRMLIESSDPITLFVMLPSVPIILILTKLIRWEDQYLRIWRNHSKTIPILKFFFKEPPAETGRESVEKILLGRDSFANSVSSARMICSALLLPSIANLIGNYCFRDVESNLQRTLLGGLSFIFVKGLFKIYLRQNQYIKHSNRRILNYEENNQNSQSDDNLRASNEQVDIDDVEG